MKIAIYGPAKTGTTALYYKIQEAFEPAVDGYFEPQRRAIHLARARRILTGLRLRAPRALVAKFLPFARDSRDIIAALGPFDREILLVRDPRDCLVSAVLYSFYHAELVRDEAAVRDLLALIRAKEADPASVPLNDIVAALVSGSDVNPEQWVASYARHFVATPMEFHAMHPDIHVMRYEDLVRYRFDDLSRYLDTVLSGEPKVGAATQRVIRTKQSGDWSNWFTTSDVTFWAPILKPYLDHYYPDASWVMDAPAVLPTATGSQYVGRLINERRALLKLPPFDLGTPMRQI